MNENLDDAPEDRPCAHCGRAVPQRSSAGRPFRYCRDNDGECQRASRNSRMRHRSSPGLAGQVARTWEVVDRLDTLVGTLTDALHSELSPAGVERQLAELRAETSGQIAAAHTERDDARRDAERAGTAVANAQQLAAASAAERDEARNRAEESGLRCAAAQRSAEQSAAARDEARREATAAIALRERAEAERDTARDDLTAVRAERDATERDLATALRDAQAAAERADQLRQERDDARRATEQLQAAHRELGDRLTAAQTTTDAVRREAAAEQATAREALAAAVAERDALRRTADRLTGERADLERRLTQDRTDLERRLAAARTEAEAAQTRVAQLSTQVSDLASALATLGTARTTPAAPAQPARTPDEATAPA